MTASGLTILLIALISAAVMHGYNIFRIEQFMRRTRGVIRFRPDLMAVKTIININMRMAIVYLALYIIFFMVMVIMFVSGNQTQAITILFLFGVITLPLGMIGKNYEKKIKNLQIDAHEPDIAETYQRWLRQWKEARFQLPD